MSKQISVQTTKNSRRNGNVFLYSGGFYIAGKKLDATQMHSQNMTVEVLSRLLENMDDEMPNSAFPLSSYTKQKNEMTSKVISPLKKIIRKKLGKDLPIICSGQLYSFTLQLKKSDIKFGVLKRFAAYKR